MAGIFVIGPRHRRALERRVLVPVVPVDDEPVAVRVEHRYDDDHRAAKLVERRVVVRYREGMKQLDRCLGGADLCRVDAAADDDDDLVCRREPAGVGFVERARIGQTLVVEADLLEVADVFWRRHDRRECAMPVGCGSELSEPDAIRGCGNLFEVLLDAPPPSPAGRRLRCGTRSAWRAWGYRGSAAAPR